MLNEIFEAQNEIILRELQVIEKLSRLLMLHISSEELSDVIKDEMGEIESRLKDLEQGGGQN